jgi:hypothetical protein
MVISSKHNAILLDYCEVLELIHYHFMTKNIGTYSFSNHPLEKGFSINN